MPTTRSATSTTRQLSANTANGTNGDTGTKPKAIARKRKASTTDEPDGVLVKKTKTGKKGSKAMKAALEPVNTGETVSFEAHIAGPEDGVGEDAPVFVPAVLTFDYEEAKQHLVKVDLRFEEVFRRQPCKPFEQLERVHPFRDLTTSIL